MSASNVFASSLRACRVAARQTAARVPAPRTSGSFLATARPARVSRQPTIFSLAKRSLSTTATRMHGHVTPPKPGEELYITFIDKDDMEHKLAVSAGDNLLDIAQAHDLEMEVLDDKYYDAMPEPEDDENDMLDLAFGLTETSRLGCQVTMTKALDGMKVKLPSMTRNLQASDFK
ncbi:hypothetical protein PoMZ_03632 [Pyricularia oryzae]|uniref:2Fe-2S iron-sulfur cluster binding domain-containing protein n=1 Tax=Pyricularia oryzae TaxID=318829 RepID=A0A4P7ND54_PYROR|nr:hypothetical protein PoMZ_03632 [Pyricularia oryzae]